MKTNILSLCLLGLIFSFGSCQKEQDEVAPKSPDGIWVERQARQDTLQFLDGPYFDLRRGKELTNGLLLPKDGSGRYDFQIQGDSISLWYTFSGNTHRHQYFFNVQTETITIDNFFQNRALSQRLTFVRLR